MAKAETIKQRPAYSAWLINHAGRVCAITGVILFGGMLLIPKSEKLFDPKVHQFTWSAIALIFSLFEAMFFSTVAILFLRTAGVREIVIKLIVMAIFFWLVGAFVYYTWKFYAVST